MEQFHISIIFCNTILSMTRTNDVYISEAWCIEATDAFDHAGGPETTPFTYR